MIGNNSVVPDYWVRAKRALARRDPVMAGSSGRIRVSGCAAAATRSKRSHARSSASRSR